MRDALRHDQLAAATWQRQWLDRRRSVAVDDAVAALGGLQAQVPTAPFWALQARVEGCSPALVAAALDDGRLLRSSLIRGTLHVVDRASHGVYATVAEESLARLWTRLLTPAAVEPGQLHAVVRAACTDRPVGRDELVAAVVDWLTGQPGGADAVGGIVGNNHGHVIRAHPWLVCQPAGGEWRRRGSWLYSPAPSVRDGIVPGLAPTAALAELIVRQLTALGPCALADLRTWTGESRLGRLRAALQQLGDRVRTYRSPDGEPLYDLDGAVVPTPADLEWPVRFLGEFDTALIGFAPANRQRLLPPEFATATYNRANGLWRACVVVDGRVAGTWRTSRPTENGPATLNISLLRRISAVQRRAVHREAADLLATAEPDRDHRIEFAA